MSGKVNLAEKIVGCGLPNKSLFPFGPATPVDRSRRLDGGR
jgi:hypothetical protein